MLADSAIEEHLARGKFEPIYRDWLPQRDDELRARLAAVPVRPRARILLLNATKGLQLYPSIVDYFVRLTRAHPSIRVVSASYFPEIYELERGVGSKGLRVVAMRDLVSAGTELFQRFDLVLAVGPSEAFAALVSVPGLKARLVLLDLGFYHQLIEANDGTFLSHGWHAPPVEPKNPVVAYSCQPEVKATRDLEPVILLDRFEWRSFAYIPVGFSYATYCRSEQHLFDVALLGTAGRNYADLDPDALRGLRVVFLGAIEAAPDLLRLRESLDITLAPRVDESRYARFLACSRAVALPMGFRSENVLLSLTDSLAAGKALFSTRHAGAARLEAEGAPIAFFANGGELSHGLAAATRDTTRLRDLGERSIEFAKTHLDIYRILERITREQLA